MIHDIKFDTNDCSILQISSQEPSMSSKNDCVLDALFITLGSWKSEYKEWHIMLIQGVKFDTENDTALQNSSQEPSMSSKNDCVLLHLYLC